jgi:hypothetical protein
MYLVGLYLENFEPCDGIYFDGLARSSKRNSLFDGSETEFESYYSVRSESLNILNIQDILKKIQFKGFFSDHCPIRGWHNSIRLEKLRAHAILYLYFC